MKLSGPWQHEEDGSSGDPRRMVLLLSSQPNAYEVPGFFLGSEHEEQAYRQSTIARKSQNCTHQQARMRESEGGGVHKNRETRSPPVLSILWYQSLELSSRRHPNRWC